MTFWVWIICAFLLGALWGWYARAYDDDEDDDPVASERKRQIDHEIADLKAERRSLHRCNREPSR